MKKILCIFAAMFAGGALAWGPGHDVVARCVLEKLPAEWRARFKPEWMKPYLAASHLPDNGSLKLLRPEDLEWLRANCGLKDKAFPLHYPPGFLGEVTRLVHAIRTGDDYSVFIYLSSISHAIADPAACNHDPIIHILTYTWGGEGLNLLPKTGRPLPVDFVFAEHDADTRAVLARRLAALKVPDVPQNITAEALFAQMLRWDCLAMEPCCAVSQRIIESGSAWMTTGDAAAKCAAADALCDLGLWAVERTLYVFAAARRLAAQGEIEFTPERLARFKDEARTNDVDIIARPMENDSFARPYFAEKGRPIRFAALYDPTAHMASSVFCAGGRQLACQVVGSLKKIRPDLNAGLFDVRAFARDGLDPAVTPCVMVFQRVVPWRRFDVNAFSKRLKKYKESGGMVIWVEGRPPEYVLGKDVVKAMSDEGLRDGYCKPAFPVPLDEILSCSLAWVGPGGERVWPYRRKPNGRAGWTWHGSPWRCDRAKLPSDVKPILEFRAPGGRTFTTGVIALGAVYLPYNALFPYCLTDEKPSFAPFSLSLDSAGEAILRAVLAVSLTTRY